MASIYKRAQDENKKRAHWYIGYTDHTGERRTKRGFTDKAETERLAAHIEEEERKIREGLKEPASEVDRKSPLSDHIVAFERHLQNRDVGPKQVLEVTRKVRRIIDGCKFTKIADLDATDVENYLGLRRSEGMSKQTSNHYLWAAKQLVRTKPADSNPLADIPMLNVQTDCRHDRRALSAEEFAWRQMTNTTKQMNGQQSSPTRRTSQLGQALLDIYNDYLSEELANNRFLPPQARPPREAFEPIHLTNRHGKQRFALHAPFANRITQF